MTLTLSKYVKFYVDSIQSFLFVFLPPFFLRILSFCLNFEVNLLVEFDRKCFQFNYAFFVARFCDLCVI